MRLALVSLLILVAGLTLRTLHDTNELASSNLERPVKAISQRASEGVQYRVTPSNGSAPLNVTFEITNGNAETFTWEFGDGTRSVGARVEHTYFKPGQYTAKLETEANGEQTKSEELGHQEFILTYKSFEPIGPACFPSAA